MDDTTDTAFVPSKAMQEKLLEELQAWERRFDGPAAMLERILQILAGKAAD